MSKFIFLLAFFLTGCYTLPSGPFNHDDLQDPECYAKYGGQWGYCDKVYRKDDKL